MRKQNMQPKSHTEHLIEDALVTLGNKRDHMIWTEKDTLVWKGEGDLVHDRDMNEVYCLVSVGGATFKIRDKKRVPKEAPAKAKDPVVVEKSE